MFEPSRISRLPKANSLFDFGDYSTFQIKVPQPYNGRVLRNGKRVTDHSENTSDPQKGWSLHKSTTKYLKAAAKTLLPVAVTQELRRYRGYSATERMLYLKIRTLDVMGVRHLNRRYPPRTASSFLFVCFGNIMRSPMCQALMQRAVASSSDIVIVSAGLNAVPGRAAHPWAVGAAKELGISLENHRAQLLTSEMVTKADVIFAMDYQNVVQLRSRYPEAKDKIYMLGAFGGTNRSAEIDDPYYSGEDGTRQCYKVLQICIDNLVSSIPTASTFA
jgi:protein-tyrosine phosphatase